MSRSLGVKKDSFIAGYCIRQGYVFSNFAAGVNVPGLMRRFFKIRKEFLSYLDMHYLLAKNRFWDGHAKLSDRFRKTRMELPERYLLLLDSTALFEKWMLEMSMSAFYLTFGHHYLKMMVALHFPWKWKEIFNCLPLGLQTASHEEFVLLYRLGKLLNTSEISWGDLKGDAKLLAEQLIGSAGDRSTSYDFIDKTWRENPTLILQMARSAAVSKEPPDQQLQYLSEGRSRVEARLTERLKWVHPFSGGQLSDELITFSHALYRLKGERHKEMAAAWSLVRKAVRLLGDSLCSIAWLEEAEDIYFLTAVELSGLIHHHLGGCNFLGSAGIPTSSDVKAIVRVRRNEFNLLREGEPPRETREAVVEIPWKFKHKTRTSSLGLSGRYSLPGQVIAPAVVIRDQQEFSKMKPGVILVAPMTNPHWDILFGMAKGIITERGGPTSHPMLKASEYGIPAIIGVSDATKHIKDGDLLRLDGDNNQVTWESDNAQSG
jgi:phosphohistidine swiveling domain-containing protein